MTLRKLIRVGSSAAVILPKEMLQAEQFEIGDMVQVVITKPSKTKSVAEPVVDPKIIEWTNEFIEEYKPLLRKLAKS
jgi:antitoxin component of MazEF toxin-antitoxin module